MNQHVFIYATVLFMYLGSLLVKGRDADICIKDSFLECYEVKVLNILVIIIHLVNR